MKREELGTWFTTFSCWLGSHSFYQFEDIILHLSKGIRIHRGTISNPLVNWSRDTDLTSKCFVTNDQE